METSAKMMRNFVMSHPDYKQDSVVSESIAYDLLRKIAELSDGSVTDPQHLFRHMTKSSDRIPEALYKAEKFLDQKSRKTSAMSSVKASSDTVINNPGIEASNSLVNGD